MPSSSARRMPLPRSAASTYTRPGRCRASLAVLTAADMEQAGIGNVTLASPVPNGAGLVVPHRPALAGDCVRHVGEAVALVVAESEAMARDAAELVAVDYEAARSGHRCRGGGASGGAATLARGARQYRARLARIWRHRARRSSMPLSPGPRMSRGSGSSISASSWRRWSRAARWRATTRDSDRYILSCASQSAFVLRQNLAHCMGVAAGAHPRPERRCRRRFRHARDRLSGIPGAAGRGAADRPRRALAGEPLRGVSDRQPGARHDHRGGASRSDADGRFLALDIDVLASMGAYLTSHAAFIATANFARCLPVHVRHRADRSAHPLPFHQHGADRTLSRRRAARGELLPRTAGRCGGARHRASTGSNCAGAT